MRHLKTYKIFESVHDTKEEIEEVVSTCKDIILEAQDIFGNSEVKKEYKDDKVIITCLYKMLDIKRRIEEFKPTVDDVHVRLIEYMTSNGFSFKNRGESSLKYIDIISYDITYNIAFSKELDKEFIGQYLKKYNLLKESTKDDLKDILLELEDMGYKVTHNDDVLYAYTGEPSKGTTTKAIWIKDNISPSHWVDLPWFELKEYALRIKDYLGDKYLSFMWRDTAYNKVPKENPYKTVELNEDTEIDGRVWSFVIKYIE